MLWMRIFLCARPLSRKRLALVLVLSGLTGQAGCGPAPHQALQTVAPEQRVIDADLDPLLERYLGEAARKGAPVRSEFVDQLQRLVWTDKISAAPGGPSVILGRCLRFNENAADPRQRFRVVEIARPNAAGMVGDVRMDKYTLKTIVYHELGHCLHDFRGHRPTDENVIMSGELPEGRHQHFDVLVDHHFQLMKQKRATHR